MHQFLSKGHQESGGYREELQQDHPGDAGWEARERFLTDVPRALGPDGARSKLEEERKITNQLKEELLAKVKTCAKRVGEEENMILEDVPQYVKMLNLEESIKKAAQGCSSYKVVNQYDRT